MLSVGYLIVVDGEEVITCDVKQTKKSPDAVILNRPEVLV